MQKFKAGDVAPISATYVLVDSEGQVLSYYEIEKGDTLPSVAFDNHYYELRNNN